MGTVTWVPLEDMDKNFCLLILLSLSFSTQVACLKQFELKVNERGMKFKERLTFDEDSNLQIVDVPPHHDRVATRYVKDLNLILQLQVRWMARECLISKILQPQDSAIQIEALQKQNLDVYVDPENATTVNILEIEGPEMDHSEIPSSLRTYCPHDFTAKAIHVLDESNIEYEDEEGFIIKDPDMNNDVKNFDPAPHVTDTLTFLSRRKRETCINEYGKTERNCRTVHVYCPDSTGGCPSTDVFFRCRPANLLSTIYYNVFSSSCEYILTCNTAGGQGNSAQCLKHYTNVGRKCRPCCRYYDCGGDMPRCSASDGGHCFQEQSAYDGYKRKTYYVENAQECQRKCQRKDWCKHFNFEKENGADEDDDGKCKLLSRKGSYQQKPGKHGYITGPRVCP